MASRRCPKAGAICISRAGARRIARSLSCTMKAPESLQRFALKFTIYTSLRKRAAAVLDCPWLTVCSNSTMGRSNLILWRAGAQPLHCAFRLWKLAGHQTNRSQLPQIRSKWHEEIQSQHGPDLCFMGATARVWMPQKKTARSTRTRAADAHCADTYGTDRTAGYSAAKSTHARTRDQTAG